MCRVKTNRALDTCPSRPPKSLDPAGKPFDLCTWVFTGWRTLLLTISSEDTACVPIWDTAVLTLACWSWRGWAAMSCQKCRHREQVLFPQEGLETPAKQQGREYEASNFRCKGKSPRASDLSYGRVVVTVTDGLVKALQHHKVPCWAQSFTRASQILLLLESSII